MYSYMYMHVYMCMCEYVLFCVLVRLLAYVYNILRTYSRMYANAIVRVRCINRLA